MAFVKGQSGNPGGKGKLVAEELARFRRTKDLQALRAELMRIAMDAPDARDRITAIKEWHDRAYGKAPQAITGEDGGPVQLDVGAGLREALERLANS